MYIKNYLVYLIISFTLYPVSKTIFSVPDLTKTSNKINSYTIDFRGIETPPATYWSLANYHLDMTDFQKTHLNVTGGGAYGGLQTLSNGEKVAIMSFWKINYSENGETKTIRFNRIYPKGEEMDFSGEGEGTTYRASYNWNSNGWYRFVLHTWDDLKTKNTFIGQWIQDLSTKEWTLFAYFNTNLNNSYIGGGSGALSAFQEIFNRNYFNEDRYFQLRNMYVFDRLSEKWISINSSNLYYNQNPDIYKEVGNTQFYFYGKSGKRTEKNTDGSKNHYTGSISQPQNPDFSEPKFKIFNVEFNSTVLNVNWEIDPTTCPCYEYSYQLQIKEEDKYKIIFSGIITRPEECFFIITSNKFEGTYRIIVTATAISKEIVAKAAEKTIS